eukprot:COSAG06_NODE_3142_length_5784_cov_2.420682_3_plen_213_part_00
MVWQPRPSHRCRRSARRASHPTLHRRPPRCMGTLLLRIACHLALPCPTCLVSRLSAVLWALPRCLLCCGAVWLRLTCDLACCWCDGGLLPFQRRQPPRRERRRSGRVWCAGGDGAQRQRQLRHVDARPRRQRRQQSQRVGGGGVPVLVLLVMRRWWVSHRIAGAGGGAGRARRKPAGRAGRGCGAKQRRDRRARRVALGRHMKANRGVCESV